MPDKCCVWRDRKHPRLLFTPSAALASRTLNLKLVLPTVDLRWVIRRAPWLLTEEASHPFCSLTACWQNR